jgi:tetratricopeptide (TPR) repeat protein
VILINQGRDAQAYPQLVSAAEMSDEFGNPWQKGTALVHLANVALGLGEFEQARLRLDQALPIIQEIGDPWQMAFCLNNYGELYRVQGKYEKAESYYQQTRDYYQEADAMGDQARLIYTFGFLALHKGDLEAAETLFKESLEDFRKLGNKRGIAECLAGLARLAVEQGHRLHCEWAAPLLSAAGTQMQSSGAAWWPADRMEIEKTLEMLRAGLGEERFQELMELGKHMSLEQAVAYATNHSR